MVSRQARQALAEDKWLAFNPRMYDLSQPLSRMEYIEYLAD